MDGWSYGMVLYHCLPRLIWIWLVIEKVIVEVAHLLTMTLELFLDGILFVYYAKLENIIA